MVKLMVPTTAIYTQPTDQDMAGEVEALGMA